MRHLMLGVCLLACNGKDDPSKTPPTTGGTPTGEPTSGTPTGTPGGTATTPTGLLNTDFGLGIEYAEVGLMDAYSATGVTWTKPRLEAVEWGNIELAAPVGAVHTYDWSCADAMIVGSQQAGFTDIQAYLSPKSSWGSVAADSLLFPDIMYDVQFEADFRLWLRALIERYDGDGVDDAPGLLHPVNHWVVGPEWTGFWPSDDHEDYLRFAQVTAEEARQANPSVQLGTIPLLFADTFSGNEPSATEIQDRLDNSTLLRNSTEGILAILDHPEHFDSISIHALGHYTDVPPTIAWLNDQMDQRGYRYPIWIDDAFPMGPLANNAGLPALYPVTYPQYDDVYNVLVSIALLDETTTPPYSEAAAWMEAEVSKGLVQKGVTALGEGAAGIQLGNLEDWMLDPGFLAEGFRNITVGLIGAAASFGMMEVGHPDGYDLCDGRVPGEPRPGFYAMQQLAAAIGDGQFDRVVRLGGLEGARGYRLERGSQTTWVLWNEPGAPLILPGEPAAPAVSFDIDVASGAEVTVERVITLRGETAQISVVPVNSGVATLSLDAVPIIVRD